MAARISIVLCLVLMTIGAALVASPADARAVPAGGYAAPPPAGDIMTGATIAGGRPEGIRRGRWNVRSLQDGTHKRTVPGGPDPQHHY
jgi:hypothetical protein